jgi:uncharacterized membrane protein
MTDSTPTGVPPELQKSRESKDLAGQKAEDQLKGEVKRGEAFLVAIGYISFLCILPLVLLKDSKFAQYHGKQALVLAIFIYFFDFVQIFPPLIASIYTALKTIVVIYSIYMSFNGKYFKIPFIYALSEKFSINISSEQDAKS